MKNKTKIHDDDGDVMSTTIAASFHQTKNIARKIGFTVLLKKKVSFRLNRTCVLEFIFAQAHIRSPHSRPDVKL